MSRKPQGPDADKSVNLFKGFLESFQGPVFPGLCNHGTDFALGGTSARC